MTSSPLPPYVAISVENPPPYSQDVEEERESECSQYTPGPALLNQNHPVDPFTLSSFPRIRDHYMLTIIMMVLCGVLLNVPAFICLLPALKFSKKSVSARQCGDYSKARSKAQWSLWLNVAALISYLVLMMLGIGLVIIIMLTL